MATNYGFDTSCLSDVPLISVTETDPRVVIGQRLARRLQTPAGGLAVINGNPNGGWDVRQYLNAKLSPGDIAAAQVVIGQECQKDEQVKSASCSMTLNRVGELSISIAVVSLAGPFQMVLTVDQLTASLVFSFGQ